MNDSGYVEMSETSVLLILLPCAEDLFRMDSIKPNCLSCFFWNRIQSIYGHRHSSSTIFSAGEGGTKQASDTLDFSVSSSIFALFASLRL